MNVQKQINNLEVLLAAVEAQPEEQFDLSMFRNDSSCGTLFCTAGLACTLPLFQLQGFALVGTDVGWGRTAYHVTVNGADVRDCGPSDAACGPDSYQALFEPAGDGMYDSDLGYEYEYEYDYSEANMTDKELAIARLKNQIELLEDQA